MNPANKQEVKVALVTGSARRIGAAVVRKIHEAGYKVVIHCRYTLGEAHALAMDLNRKRVGSALVLQRDLTGDGAAEELIKSISDWAGRLDVLVNNASIFTRTEGANCSAADWEALFAINVKAPYLLSLAARSLLIQHQGVIVNITDIHAEMPLKGYGVYCQTKAALEMQTKALAYEFAPEIRVNAVAPGSIIWPEHANSLNEAEKKKITGKILLQRTGSPEFIAQAVLALVENPYITGQILKVDGGRSCK
ncbi:MAG: pteridine reductase [Legionellales bacterium]